MATRLYVGNLSFQTTSEDLRDHFAQIGNVESAQVVEDRMTGRSRGFGFVEMTSPDEAAAAIDQLNGKEFGGRNLTVNEARPRTDRAQSARKFPDRPASSGACPSRGASYRRARCQYPCVRPKCD